ncbi:MAG: glycogen/starch synthase, partial [Thermoanaerobaculia bacterium]
MRPLKICLLSAEVSPFAKTGGLGDVTAALARYLWRRGQDVRLFLPLYSRIDTRRYRIAPVEFIRDVPVKLGGRELRFTACTARLPGTALEIYSIDCPGLYDRPALYTSDGDEHLRFALLGRAALESCQRMGWSPDVVHCNDWHTALVPLELKTLYSWDGLFAASKTLLTLHNIGYQGIFPAAAVEDLGLAADAHLLRQEDLRSDRLNFLKTGILYADLLSTVSPTHAREIQSDEYGMGLQELLRQRSDHLVGILNGVDYEVWNPESDRLIPFHYSREDLAGKEQNKQALLPELGLPYAPEVPALGLVSRLVVQKGLDLLQEVLPEALGRFDLRLVALGSGDQNY